MKRLILLFLFFTGNAYAADCDIRSQSIFFMRNCSTFTFKGYDAIRIGDHLDVYLIDKKKIFIAILAMRYDRQAQEWYRYEPDDRIIWEGTVEVGNSSCRYKGKAGKQYIISDGSTLCVY